MQVAVRPASVSRGACALAAVTVAAEKGLCRYLQGSGKSRCVRQESWCHPIVRFEAAQQARFIGSDTRTGSNLLAKQASILAWTSLPLTEVEPDQSAKL